MFHVTSMRSAYRTGSGGLERRQLVAAVAHAAAGYAISEPIGKLDVRTQAVLPGGD
jgi:hypothetical protein